MSDAPTDIRYRRAAGAVTAEVDGQTVLVSPADLTYYGLNRSSTAIWHALPTAAEPPVAAAVVVDVVLGQFDIDRERADVEVATHLERLVEAGLIDVLRA